MNSTNESEINRFVIRRPDDWHVHLRDGAMLRAALPWTAAQFARGIIMPNLEPPVATAAAALEYRTRILAALPKGASFQPLMTCYLTEATEPDEVERGYMEGIWIAAKLYPTGVTTNAHNGVSDVGRIRKVLERLECIGMKLLIHGEVANPDVDIFDREAVFVETILAPMLREHPGLKIVLEHVTTADAVDFVRAHASQLAATITPHHLLINRTSLFQGGLRPHLYCLPIAKRERHRLALRRAATGGEGSFFLGTDSALHTTSAKESSCGCAGCFVSPTALQTYVEVFEEENALRNFERFASLNGPRFYGLPANEEMITLVRRTECTPSKIDVDDGGVVVFRGGERLSWSIERFAQ